MKHIPAILLSLIPLVAVGQSAVEVKPTATVLGPALTLGEIATVSSDSPADAAKLKGVQLGNAPWPGNTREIDFTTIRTRLEESGIAPQEIQWSGSPRTTVFLATRRVTGGEILAAATQWLTETLGRDGGEIVVGAAEALPDCLLPARANDLTLTTVAVGRAGQNGRAQLVVEVRGAGTLWRKVPVALDVQIFRSVAVAKEGFANGQPLDPAKVQLERADVARLSGVPIERLEDLNDASAGRGILPGSVLTTDVVRVPPAIKRGDVVLLRVHCGSIVVSARAQARQDGRRGEMIALMNIDSKREVVGRVIDSRVVEVAL